MKAPTTNATATTPVSAPTKGTPSETKKATASTPQSQPQQPIQPSPSENAQVSKIVMIPFICSHSKNRTLETALRLILANSPPYPHHQKLHPQRIRPQPQHPNNPIMATWASQLRTTNFFFIWAEFFFFFFQEQQRSCPENSEWESNNPL